MTEEEVGNYHNYSDSHVLQENSFKILNETSYRAAALLLILNYNTRVAVALGSIC